MTLIKRTVAVTGAFSYSGQYIARRFLETGWDVITLTRDPNRSHPLQGKITAFPLDFTDPQALTKSLRGADTLVNTYWVRFEYLGSSFAQAVENSGILLRAAEATGVRRVVHISVSRPELGSDLPYYRGKAAVEELVKQSRLSYSILRPTIIFGKEEVLISNITWLLRHLPAFVIPGDGKYRLQPIYVEDLADLALKAAQSNKNEIIDAGGPEVFTYEELVRFLAKLAGSRALLLHLSPSLALVMAKLLGLMLGDVLLTRYELLGLMEERLYVGLPGAAQTAFSAWAQEHADTLGKQYVNELKRHHGKRTLIGN
jgi:NADH dehydrogenase